MDDRKTTAVARWCLAVLIVAATLVAGVEPRGFAQAQRRVQGVIRNEGGGAIDGATVALADQRGTRQSVRSDRDGRYDIAVAADGPMTLTVKARGFESASRSLTPPEGETAVVDVTLRLAITDRVEVSTRPLEPGPIMSTLTLTGQGLNALPEDPEGLLQALRMLAGTAGTRTDQVAFYVDGLPMDRRLPPKSVIQTIRIDADALSAEYPEPGGSRVEIVTKPASGDVYADVRAEFNNSALNARNAFEPTEPDVQLQTYVGYIGVPIVKNRLGLLGYLGRWDQRENVVINATTLNPATLQPLAIQENASTPSLTRSYSLKADGLISPHHTLSVEFGQDRQERPNAGLQSGFDLPDRAFASGLLDRALTVRLTSAFSDRGLNELRIRRSRHETTDQAIAASPAVLVLEAFNGGGNQENLFRGNTVDEVVVSDVATFSGSTHALRIGGTADLSNVEQLDRSNFGGTFTFGSDVVRDAFGRPVTDPGGHVAVITPLQLYGNVIGGVPGYTPSQFSIARGDPRVTFSTYQLAGFVQDDWRFARNATVSLGVRTEVQQDLSTHLNVAPRTAVAWALSNRSTLRGGLGVFYTPVPTTVVSDVNRLDGQHVLQFVVDQPGFFANVPPALPALRPIVMIRKAAPDLATPSTVMSTISFDQQIAARVFGSIAVSWKRGLNLLRTTAVDPPILQFESSGSSRARELRGTVNATVSTALTLFGNYIWTAAEQDTDGPYAAPASSLDLGAEWGPATLPRHQATIGGSVALPWKLTASPFVRIASALPFNITTGSDNNNDTLFTDRPAYAAPGTPNAVATPWGTFNLNPAPGAPLIPRNLGLGAGEFTVDLVVARTFDPQLIDGRMSVFVTVNNLTNHTNYLPFNGVLTSPYFGAANGATNARRVTLSFRYEF